LERRRCAVMVEPEETVPEDVANGPVQALALADDQAPDLEASEPMICDPVIGFVCLKHARL
jgi:hypothetical protein